MNRTLIMENSIQKLQRNNKLAQEKADEFRKLFRAGEKKFMTSKGSENQHIGIIGLGRIGKEIGSMIKPFRPASVSYFSKHKHNDSDLEYQDFDFLLKESDIVFLCVSKDAGKYFFGKEQLAQMKDGSLLVSFVHRGPLDETALFDELVSKRIRAVSDYYLGNGEFEKLPFSHWYCFNGSNAFNTETGIQLTSDRATDSIINLLNTGEDKNKVN